MHWADKVAADIINSGKYMPFWVDDMKTPSGYPHIGSLRGPLIHDLIFKALKSAGKDTKYTFIINDLDPMDDVSLEFKDDLSKYLGLPLKQVPSPDNESSNFADFIAKDFMRVLTDLGVAAEFISSWDLYKEGKFDTVIRQALDNAEKIQDIYQRVSGSQKRDQGWLPFQTICQKCGKLGTTRVFEWNGTVVSYRCEENMVKWAIGCGFEGKVSPFGGTGKLPWKVDWPAHWVVLGITIEGAGKDHSSAGGSRDIAREICKEVFQYPEPYNLPYEFLLFGGRKMSSSKGVGLKARDVSSILPFEIARFLFTRTDYKTAVDFNHEGTMAIPDLYDEYDRCFKSFIKGDGDEFARSFELAHIGELPCSEQFLPRFRDLANYLQIPNIDLVEKFAEIKGQSLNQPEVDILKEREKYARIWLEKYAPDDFKVSMVTEIPSVAKNLDSDQKRFLQQALEYIKSDLNAEDLQAKLYELTKTLEIPAKKAFAAIYLSFIGKEYGPKAGSFLRQYSIDEVTKRLSEVIND